MPGGGKGGRYYRSEGQVGGGYVNWADLWSAEHTHWKITLTLPREGKRGRGRGKGEGL